MSSKKIFPLWCSHNKVKRSSINRDGNSTQQIDYQMDTTTMPVVRNLNCLKFEKPVTLCRFLPTDSDARNDAKIDLALDDIHAFHLDAKLIANFYHPLCPTPHEPFQPLIVLVEIILQP